MDMKEEMMSDAVDDVMDDEDEGEGEEAEGDKVLREVLDEIGVGYGQMVRSHFPCASKSCSCKSVISPSSEKLQTSTQLQLQRYPPGNL